MSGPAEAADPGADDGRDPVARGARNLLLGCAGLAPGDPLLIVREDPALG